MKLFTSRDSNHTNQTFNGCAWVLVVLALGCFAISPTAQAVSPAPDGGYPNFTTAEGQNALHDLTSGAGNTALGAYSLFSTTTASFNTAVGAGALDLNTGDENTAVGVAALIVNTGTQNTAVGVDALGLNTTGEFNAAVGAFALYNNTTGGNNTAIGDNALENCTVGVDNVAIGKNAGANVVTGNGNIYIGENVQGPTDEELYLRIGDNSIFAYETYIVGIYGRGVDSSSAALVYVDGNQKMGTELVDANENRVPFKPQAMLDESLKQQKRIDELQGTVERLAAMVKEQAAQIQKVSAQLELSKPAPQTVLNNP